MSRSYTVSKPKIPRSFFPAKPGEKMQLKDRVVTTFAYDDSTTLSSWKRSIGLKDRKHAVYLYFNDKGLGRRRRSASGYSINGKRKILGVYMKTMIQLTSNDDTTEELEFMEGDTEFLSRL